MRNIRAYLIRRHRGIRRWLALPKHEPLFPADVDAGELATLADWMGLTSDQRVIGLAEAKSLDRNYMDFHGWER